MPKMGTLYILTSLHNIKFNVDVLMSVECISITVVHNWQSLGGDSHLWSEEETFISFSTVFATCSPTSSSTRSSEASNGTTFSLGWFTVLPVHKLNIQWKQVLSIVFTITTACRTSSAIRADLHTFLTGTSHLYDLPTSSGNRQMARVCQFLFELAHTCYRKFFATPKLVPSLVKTSLAQQKGPIFFKKKIC